MREIGNELISKHLYMSINALLQPLLEPYESGERKSEISYPPIDYSVHFAPFRITIINLWLIQSSTI